MIVWIYDTWALDKAIKNKNIGIKEASEILGKDVNLIRATMQSAYMTVREVDTIKEKLKIEPTEYAYLARMPDGLKKDERNKWSWNERFKHLKKTAKTNIKRKSKHVPTFVTAIEREYVTQVSVSGQTKWNKYTKNGDVRVNRTC